MSTNVYILASASVSDKRQLIKPLCPTPSRSLKCRQLPGQNLTRLSGGNFLGTGPGYHRWLENGVVLVFVSVAEGKVLESTFYAALGPGPS